MPIEEELPPPPPPAPAIADETDIFTPINREGVTEESIKILTASEATKRLNKIFGDASKDKRYLNTYKPHYRNRKPNNFGKVHGSKLKDKDLSMILAMMPEAEQLCKKFKVPMIRGIQGSSNSMQFNASMGDGVMGIQQNFASFSSWNIGVNLKEISEKNKKEFKNQVEILEKDIKKR